jgi:hypothetical protein
LQHASYSRSGAQDRSKGGILKIKEIVNFGSIGNRSPPTFSLCLSITFFFSQVHEFCLLKNVDLIFDTFYARLRYLVMAFYFIKLHDLKDFFFSTWRSERKDLFILDPLFGGITYQRRYLNIKPVRVHMLMEP